MNNSTSTKKAIFIGNSFIYYGGCVTSGERGGDRCDDRGLFYTLASRSGVDISVTDATYGGRILANFTPAGDEEGRSTAGVDLLGNFDLSSYEYVFISEAGRNNKNFLFDLENVKVRFTNPSVKFFYLIHNYTMSCKHNNITDACPSLIADGVTIIPWGALAFDLWSGARAIEGATCSYNKNSFVVNQSSSDGYHPNPLSGYIAAQMCFSAMNGTSAEGTDVSFCEEVIDFAAYTDRHYGYEGSVTNFSEIFHSKIDISAIQTLIDEYLTIWNSGK